MTTAKERRNNIADRLEDLRKRVQWDTDYKILTEAIDELRSVRDRTFATVPKGSLRPGSATWHIVRLLERTGRPMTTKEIGAELVGGGFLKADDSRDMSTYLNNARKGGAIIKHLIKSDKNWWGYESTYALPGVEVPGERYVEPVR